MIGRTVSFSEPSPVSGLVTVQLSAQAPTHESAEKFVNEKYCADGLVVRREGGSPLPKRTLIRDFSSCWASFYLFPSASRYVSCFACWNV